jgi:proton glutamate symport protein
MYFLNEGSLDKAEPIDRLSRMLPRRLGLTHWIMISMVAGVLFGWLFPELSQHLKVISNVFLRMIKCILVPLVFSTLVVGIASHGQDLKAVGKLAFKSIIYFEVITTFALVIGLCAVNLIQPGLGVKLPPVDPHAEKIPATQVTLAGIIEHIVPKSFFEAAAANDVLQVVFFAIVFSIALVQIEGRPKESMLHFFEGVMEVMFKFTAMVMKFAPFGVGAAMAYTIGHSGVGVLLNLAKLIGTLYLALICFCLVILWPVALWARIPILGFLKAVREPALLAFSTTSSDAALPDAMKKMIQFGVPRRIVSFVMPLGYSFNLDGSTVHLSVASLFIAQAAGIHLSLTQQLAIVVTLMLTSKGMAGIPRASQVILAGTLVTFGLPLEGLILIIGVDELLDMARTTVNLIGNCLATAVIARWEGEFGPTDEAASAQE